MLLADKQMTGNAAFMSLSNDNFDNEVNRLLILVAVITRQLLENTDNEENRFCGIFWHDYPAQKNCNKLKFKQACSMIIHAKDIHTKVLDYYYSEDTSKPMPGQKALYFKDKITIIGQKKNRAEIEVRAFVQHCINLSNKIKGVNHAIK